MSGKDWMYLARTWGEVKVLGEAGQDPVIQAMAREHRKRSQEAAHTLFEWLIIDGLKERISVEDIESLASIGETPEFMRKIIIELMLCLRNK